MATASISVPPGFTLHTENSTHLLIPSTKEAFLNPVQEFNRDLSVACITVWSEELNAAKKVKWQARRNKNNGKSPEKKRKCDLDQTSASVSRDEFQSSPKSGQAATASSSSPEEVPSPKDFTPHKFTMLEPLAATGLRSIRFAKEVPLLKYIVANDLSPHAVEAMQRNVSINGLGSEEAATANSEDKIRIKLGDACSLMYSHRTDKTRVDCIDLDPYGTVAPFVDAAVQAVADGGLLCVTCTDLAVLATNNYPEKCFANYGGVPAKAEYCHEVALRLVLHLLSSSAARYGRFIHPLTSLSIDFYVRIFVQIRSAPVEVKRAFSQTGMVYVCSFCQAPSVQPLGRIIERTSDSGNVNLLYRQNSGPPCQATCPECDSSFHVSGPLWTGPLHDKAFVARVLRHIDDSGEHYKTSLRMKGMLTVVQEELTSLFYFTPAKIASFFNCLSPSLEDVASALLNAGHEVSRSHACAGSLKTSAARRDIYDVFRTWIQSHPVVMKNIAKDSPKQKLLAKSPLSPANFSRHARASLCASSVKLVRYQQNPMPNWGPGTKAKAVKRRRSADTVGSGGKDEDGVQAALASKVAS